MFSETELEDLIAGMRKTGIRELRVDGVDGFLELVLPEAAVETANEASLESGLIPATRVSVKSPALGLFRPCGDGDGLAPIAPGSNVRKGQIMGYIADGCAQAPIEAPASGIIAAGGTTSGAVVGYGDIVFELEAEV